MNNINIREQSNNIEQLGYNNLQVEWNINNTGSSIQHLVAFQPIKEPIKTIGKPKVQQHIREDNHNSILVANNRVHNWHNNQQQRIKTTIMTAERIREQLRVQQWRKTTPMVAQKVRYDYKELQQPRSVQNKAEKVATGTCQVTHILDTSRTCRQQI